MNFCMNIIAGKSGRRSLPSHPSVSTTESLYAPNRRAHARQDLDGNDVADYQRQALRRRQTRSSRHQGLRDGFHRR